MCELPYSFMFSLISDSGLDAYKKIHLHCFLHFCTSFSTVIFTCFLTRNYIEIACFLTRNFQFTGDLPHASHLFFLGLYSKRRRSCIVNSS